MPTKTLHRMAYGQEVNEWQCAFDEARIASPKICSGDGERTEKLLHEIDTTEECVMNVLKKLYSRGPKVGTHGETRAGDGTLPHSSLFD